jgi:hypothetical protein
MPENVRQAHGPPADGPACRRDLDFSPARGQSRKSKEGPVMIRKLKSGEYRLYSRKIDPKTKRRRNLGTFKTRAAAAKHERAVQYFKRH